MNNNYYHLPKIILNDLIKFYKHILILLLIITISSILLITIIQKTRLLISREEQLNIIKNKIESEWNTLIIERSLLTSHSRVEQNAIKKLNMTYVDPFKEKIIIQSEPKK
ncbi:MAG: cell division protein FtsL [Buchnera aphidicola (Melaphis rhois)]